MQREGIFHRKVETIRDARESNDETFPWPLIAVDEWGLWKDFPRIREEEGVLEDWDLE